MRQLKIDYYHSFARANALVCNSITNQFSFNSNFGFVFATSASFYGASDWCWIGQERIDKGCLERFVEKAFFKSMKVMTFEIGLHKGGHASGKVKFAG